MKSRLRFAAIPSKYANARFKDLSKNVYEDAQSRQVYVRACNAVNDYFNDFDKWQSRGMGLYFYSETKGSGKTLTMAALANELMHRLNKPVKFCTSLQILDEIKATWDRQGGEYETEHKLLDALVTTEVLIIDDFGTEQVKDWVQDKFYQIINGRYIDNKVTLYTSNIDLNRHKYDDRITNRIKEKAFQIPFPEESVREHIAEQNLKELMGD